MITPLQKKTGDVYAKIIKIHNNGKYDIKLNEPPYSEEKEVDGKYLLIRHNK